ncbi:MAG: UDP-3-O-acyl-N-acetylglucosamine deacetylase [Thermodesulfovibrionia bacterium]|nr:UDP-3-O-acyl-N-acetylglucosamine deacetylase [Thermodesulfovibrionia bacterium]
MRLQNTIKKEIHLQGKGLHTGRDIRLRLRPAPRDTGIIFVRTDKGNAEIKACVSSVSDTTFATTLSSHGAKVGTVEHLLAAFAGLNVDNVYVDLDGPEVPVMDGSAIAFVSLILEAGVAQQAKTITCIRIFKPIAIMEGPSQIAITPYEGTKITYRLYYTHPAFGEQKMGIDVYRNSFIDELAPARTFGFLSDVEKMRARGLARGGSLENAIVLGQNEIINKEMLRFKDEFVRHKILDLIGDMSLLGVPIYGHIIANKSGHTMNVKLLKKILLSRDSWEIVSESPVKLSVLESIA